MFKGRILKCLAAYRYKFALPIFNIQMNIVINLYFYIKNYYFGNKI